MLQYLLSLLGLIQQAASLDTLKLRLSLIQLVECLLVDS